MTHWEILGAAAYTLTYALFESLVLLVVVMLLAVLLPARLARDEFAVRATGALYISMPWIVVALMVETRSYYLYLLPLVICLLFLRLFYLLLRDFGWVTATMRALLDRLSVLSSLYLTVDVLAILVVIARNI
jgi:hypothetical protein